MVEFLVSRQRGGRERPEVAVASAMVMWECWLSDLDAVQARIRAFLG